MTEEMRSSSTRRNCHDLKSAIIDADLCCGCGTCVGVCPTGALTIDLFQSHQPTICRSKCIQCGLCYEVCPGRGYPIVEWASRSCDEATMMDLERGPVRHYWIGHSTDPGIRLNSASGGIATSFLLYLLETGRVEDVVVIGMESERPVVKLTDDPAVVRDAAMSKYGPVPMLATVIPELRKRSRRIAMTVTPCQLAGLRRATERIPKLRDSIVLTVGLFCGYIQSYDALTSIGATLGVRYPGDAKFVAWRYGPYPGSARFERLDGAAVEKPLYRWLDLAVPHFSLNRCFLCPDCGNWLADITLGDDHKELTDQTLIVCRTRRGADALEGARLAGVIDYRPLEPARVIRDPVLTGTVRGKLLPAIACNAWLNKRDRPSTQFDYDARSLLRGELRSLVPFWIWKYRLTIWVRTGWRRRYLLKHPALLERTGHFLYYFPATIPGWFYALKTVKVFCRVLKYLEARLSRLRVIASS